MVSIPQGPCYSDLRGKTVLVTGGGSGIGRSISLRMASEGLHVFMCGRTMSTLEETAASIAEAGQQSTVIEADVSDEDSVGEMFARISEKTPSLDVLVHNAALVRSGSFDNTSTEFWHKMMATNLDSAFFLCKHAVEMMKPQRSGSIILISTIGAVQAHHSMIAYDTSKGGLESFCRAMALELAADGIRVNCVSPGATKRRYHLSKEIPLDEIAHRHVPLGRFASPAEPAAAVAFLASVQSSYITGTTITVDGGATAQLTPRSTRI